MEPDVPPNDEAPVDHVSNDAEAPADHVPPNHDAPSVHVPADADTPSVDHDEPAPRPAPEPTSQLDLDRVERDLADVETALERLDAGTYWTDEITGAPITDDALAADPLRRRAPTGGR